MFPAFYLCNFVALPMRDKWNHVVCNIQRLFICVMCLVHQEFVPFSVCVAFQRKGMPVWFLQDARCRKDKNRIRGGREESYGVQLELSED